MFQRSILARILVNQNMGGEFTIPIPYTWASCLDVVLFPGVYKVTREIMWIPPAR